MPKGVPAPNHTQTPNYLLDHLSEVKSEAELKVILAIVRKTFGWHKDRDVLSLTQLQTLTGLSRRSVIDGTEAAVTHGWIDRIPAGRSFSYALVVRDSEETALSDSEETAPTSALDSAESSPKLVQKVHTQKKEKETKDLNKKPSGADAPAVVEPDPVKELVMVFETASGIKLPTPGKYAKKAQREVGAKWWNPLRQMVQIANGSSPDILREVVADMRRRKITLADPNGALKNFISLAGERATATAASGYTLTAEDVAAEYARLNPGKVKVAS